MRLLCCVLVFLASIQLWAQSDVRDAPNVNDYLLYQEVDRFYGLIAFYDSFTLGSCTADLKPSKYQDIAILSVKESHSNTHIEIPIRIYPDHHMGLYFPQKSRLGPPRGNVQTYEYSIHELYSTSNTLRKIQTYFGLDVEKVYAWKAALDSKTETIRSFEVTKFERVGKQTPVSQRISCGEPFH